MKLITYIFLVVLFSCCTEDPKPYPVLDMKQLKENLIEANKKALIQESTQIEKYINEKKLNVLQTKTGLRYFIYKNVEGPTIVENQKAVIAYKVSLLNGTICYETMNKPEEFTVEKDYVESGLHEGVQFMSVGDKAIIIIPSHLGHGLAGDLKKIPIKSTIVYDIELLEIK